MNNLHKLMGNLRYVTVDREAARKHWNEMVWIIQHHPESFRINRKMVIENKATAGILGHRRSLNFIKHSMKERSLNRRLAKTASLEVHHDVRTTEV